VKASLLTQNGQVREREAARQVAVGIDHEVSIAK
jgi:hypothetical protein